jgi:predicted AlkP superfamily phosphohydrolase/phosphomutase
MTKKVNGGARVFAICIDSMSLDFARPHLGRLPALRSLLADGALKQLTSPADRLTASVWASFATGDRPGAHGHYYPFQWDPEAMAFSRVSSPLWRARLPVEPFWYGLARRGVKAIAFDPGTPNDASGAPHTEIINWSYQSSGAASANDPALLAEIRRRFGRRPIGKEVPVPKTLAQSRRIRDDLIRAIDAKADAALWLMEREEWRFFLMGFFEIHRAGHNLLVVDGDFGSEADPDALLAVYEAQDRALGRILERAADANTTVIFFSLHGMEPNRAQEHFLVPILDRLADAWVLQRGGAPAAPKSANLMTRLRAAVPARIQYSLAYMLGEHVQDWVVNRGLVGGVDWSRTPVIRYASGGEGYLRLNIKGREREGCLDRNEVPEFAGWLKERLFEIKLPESGAPLVRAVYDARGLYPGERADYLPDLIVDYAPDEPARAIESPAIGRLEAHLDTGRGGNHCGDAFMIVAGPGRTHAAVADVKDIHDMRTFIETLLLDETGAAKAAPESARALADA